jgi:hypothetical protein
MELISMLHGLDYIIRLHLAYLFNVMQAIST